MKEEDVEDTIEIEKPREPTIQNTTDDFSRFDFCNVIGSDIFEKYTKNTTYYVEKISLKGAIWGKLELRENCFHFYSENNGKKPENQEEYRYGTKLEDFIETKSKRKIWKISDITKVFSRSFNLRDCALEIFTVESKAYFFNLFSKEKRNNILKKLKDYKELANSNIEIYTNKRKAYILSGLQEKWMKDEISNFDYLMQLNTFAGFHNFLNP